MFVDKQIPDFLSSFAGVERFVLGITYPAKLFVRFGWLGAVASADQLNHAFALIDLFPQNLPEIAAFGAEDFLPNRFIPEKAQGISDKLPRAFEFAANRRNE